jgi:uncharacterized protein (DUF427 family)
MNPAPGFKKYPQHRVTTEPAKQRVRVALNGEVIADTRDAIALHESMSSSHVVGPVVYYIPRKDVKMDRLVRSSHKTHCPFKGDASYFSIGKEKDAVWSYEQPYDELMPIRELLAFYPDKFTIEAEKS